MIEHDVRMEIVEMACRMTPGIESPTIVPVSKKGWVAIKSMVERK
jgi:ATP phosphoribosyltransferase